MTDIIDTLERHKSFINVLYEVLKKYHAPIGTDGLGYIVQALEKYYNIKDRESSISRFCKDCKHFSDFEEMYGYCHDCERHPKTARNILAMHA